MTFLTFLTASQIPKLLCALLHVSLSASTEKTVVLLYHKPANIVTTHANNDPLGRSNVYDDIYSMKGYRGSLRKQDFCSVTGICNNRLEAIGRLDADTSGLLLLTNDGGLVHHVTNKNAKSAIDSPIPKTYEALIMGYHEESSEMLMTMRTTGVNIGEKYGGMTLPVVCLSVISHPTSKSTLLSLTLVEGKNRQVRRMFHALKSGVIKLKRTHVGSLTLGDLEEGEWRLLSDLEVLNSLLWEPRALDPNTRRKRAAR
jgi:pseudouridine synthase